MSSSKSWNFPRSKMKILNARYSTLWSIFHLSLKLIPSALDRGAETEKTNLSTWKLHAFKILLFSSWSRLLLIRLKNLNYCMPTSVFRVSNFCLFFHISQWICILCQKTRGYKCMSHSARTRWSPWLWSKIWNWIWTRYTKVISVQ